MVVWCVHNLYATEQSTYVTFNMCCEAVYFLLVVQWLSVSLVNNLQLCDCCSLSLKTILCSRRLSIFSELRTRAPCVGSAFMEASFHGMDMFCHYLPNEGQPANSWLFWMGLLGGTTCECRGKDDVTPLRWWNDLLKLQGKANPIIKCQEEVGCVSQKMQTSAAKSHSRQKLLDGHRKGGGINLFCKQ